MNTKIEGFFLIVFYDHSSGTLSFFGAKNTNKKKKIGKKIKKTDLIL